MNLDMGEESKRIKGQQQFLVEVVSKLPMNRSFALETYASNVFIGQLKTLF